MPDLSDDDCEALIDEEINQNLIVDVDLLQWSKRTYQVIYTWDAVVPDNYACHGGRPVEGRRKWIPLLTHPVDLSTAFQVLAYMDAYLRARKGLPPVKKR